MTVLINPCTFFYCSDKADIGLIGLAVMGQNLVLNMDDHGFTVSDACQNKYICPYIYTKKTTVHNF